MRGKWSSSENVLYIGSDSLDCVFNVRLRIRFIVKSASTFLYIYMFLYMYIFVAMIYIHIWLFLTDTYWFKCLLHDSGCRNSFILFSEAFNYGQTNHDNASVLFLTVSRKTQMTWLDFCVLLHQPILKQCSVLKGTWLITEACEVLPCWTEDGPLHQNHLKLETHW